MKQSSSKKLCTVTNLQGADVVAGHVVVEGDLAFASARRYQRADVPGPAARHAVVSVHVQVLAGTGGVVRRWS